MILNLRQGEMAFRHAISVALLVFLSACGGGGGGGADSTTARSAASPGADYFPLNVGDTWYYDGANGASEVRVTGTRVVNGRTVWVLVTTDSAGTTEDLYDKSATGVMPVPAAGASAVDVAVARIPALQLPLVEGETRVPLDQSGVDAGDLDGDGRTDSASLHAEVTMVGFETLSTAAGTWTQVAHLRTVLTEVVTFSASGRTATVTGTSDDWYAPNVGPVRSQYSVTGPGTSLTDQLTLKAFHAGVMRSETVAPTITARNPLTGSVVKDMALNVSFNEPMDRHGLPADALKLTGPDGQIVSGTVSWLDDHSLSFVPANTLVSGAYVASVGAGVQDLAGNPVTGVLSWTFGVDRQGPIVVSINPANDAVEVPLPGAITIVFDEAPDPASITAANVQLMDTSQSLLATTLALNGRTLTVTPVQALQRAHYYSLSIQGIRDALGNANINATISRFKSDNGRFGPPQALAGLGLVSSPELIVDLNGDNRKDIVILGAINNPGRAGVYVYRQLADGRLAPPSLQGLQSTCDVVTLVAADMNNDGRSDLVVSTLCGIEVLSQTADGSLVTVPGPVDVPPMGVVPMAVVRGAGRPGILALPQFTSGALLAGRPLVWHQDATGNFTPPLAVPVSMQTIYDLITADLNGDGLDDLVLWGLLSNGTEYGFEVLLQQADGSFGPSREFVSNSCGGPHAIATGDVNGDGRPDIVQIGQSCDASGRVTVLVQDAAGGFTAAPVLASAANLDNVAVVDIDGDGRLDIVTLHNGYGVGIYLQRADGSMSPEEIYQAPMISTSLSVGDFTGDGLVDILAGGQLLRQKPTPVGSSGAKPGVRSAGLQNWASRLAKVSPKSAN